MPETLSKARRIADAAAVLLDTLKAADGWRPTAVHVFHAFIWLALATQEERP